MPLFHPHYLILSHLPGRLGVAMVTLVVLRNQLQKAFPSSQVPRYFLERECGLNSPLWPERENKQVLLNIWYLWEHDMQLINYKLKEPII